MLRGFISTRRHILNGTALWELADDEITRRHLLPPLRFCCYEAILAAVPAALTLWFVDGILRTGSLESAYDLLVAQFGIIDENYFAGDSPGSRLARHLWVSLTPMLVPSIFIINGWIASWSSLWRGDLSSLTRQRARRAYLFLNGAMGVRTQCLITLLYVAFVSLAPHNVDALAGVGIAAASIIALFRLWHIYHQMIPKALFRGTATIERATSGRRRTTRTVRLAHGIATAYRCGS